MKEKELNSMEKLFEAFKGVGLSAMKFSENIERASKIMKKNEENAKSSLTDNEYFAFAQPNDWKILDVNCLPEKFNETERYKVEYDTESGYFLESNDYVNGDYITVIKNAFEDKMKYRYRPTPTKKAHEELAEEYMKEPNMYPTPMSATFLEKIKIDKDNVRNAFIAGRKSIESEK